MAEINEIASNVKAYYEGERGRRVDSLNFSMGMIQLGETIRASRFKEMESKAKMFESSLEKMKVSNEDMLTRAGRSFISLIEANVRGDDGYVMLNLGAQGEEGNVAEWSEALDDMFDGKNIDSIRDDVKSAILNSKSGNFDLANSLAARLSDISKNRPDIRKSIEASGILGSIQLKVGKKAEWFHDEGKSGQIDHFSSEIINGLDNRYKIGIEEVEMAQGDYVMDQQLASSMMRKDIYKSDPKDKGAIFDRLGTQGQQEFKQQFLQDRLDKTSISLNAIDDERGDLQLLVDNEMLAGASDDDVAGYMQRLADLAEDRTSAVETLRTDNDRLLQIQSGLAELALKNLSKDIEGFSAMQKTEFGDVITSADRGVAMQKRLDQFSKQYLPVISGKRDVEGELASLQKKISESQSVASRRYEKHRRERYGVAL